MHLVKFFVVHCTALVFLAFPLGCLSASSVERNVLIGLVDNNEPGFRAEVLTPTLDYLKKTLPNISFRTVDIAAYKASGLLFYFTMVDTTPDPTVLPPSRIAKRRPSSMAMGVISLTSILTLSPGITISTPSGRVMEPVTSVVLK